MVFFAAGFETTTAPVAGLIANGLQQGLPPNLSVLLSGRLTWPAVALLLDSDTPGFDALIAPGHVSTVMGPEEWEFVAEEARHSRPPSRVSVPESLLAALYSVLRQVIENKPVPGQLLHRRGTARRQSDCTGGAEPGDGRHRRELARHRRHPGLRVSR